VTISYQDAERVPTEILEKSRLIIQPRATGFSGQTYDLQPIIIDPESEKMKLKDFEENFENRYHEDESQNHRYEHSSYYSQNDKKRSSAFMKQFLHTKR